jgi:CTP synthase
MHPKKWIIVTGGVLSGLGKGTAAASIGLLIKDNLKIVTVKCDGYLNVDPGTMNPIEHGEVFVLEDGGEVDMDFGHYERFLNTNCKFGWNLTSGKIFNSVIEKERKGEFLGKTIQIYPHIVDEIKKRFNEIAEKENAEIMLIEIGGTIGDIENSWFTEAVRQLKKDVGPENIIYVHLTYVPFLHSVGEPKTKPAQRDIALLREKGIQPNIIIARSREMLSKKHKEKIALFCDIDEECVISGRDIDTIYEIPLMFKKEGMVEILVKKLGIKPTDMTEWETLVERIKNPEQVVKVAICGKYTELKDSYASVIEALAHAGAHLGAKVSLKWIETTEIEEGKLKIEEAMKEVKGIIIPGGFGTRGAEGKIEMIKYARENNIPFLGLCFGLQLAVVEFARNVCGLDANSEEVDEKTSHPVIAILPEQAGIDKKGGTMRLGSYAAKLEEGTLVQNLYKSNLAAERHRHRYEVNPDYHDILQKNGLVFSGISENRRLVEFIELAKNKFHVATQAHPEFKSRLLNPSPLFYGFVSACMS